MKLWRIYYPRPAGELELATPAPVLGESKAAAIARARMLGLVDRRRRAIALELEALAPTSPRPRRISRRRRRITRSTPTGGRA